MKKFISHKEAVIWGEAFQNKKMFLFTCLKILCVHHRYRSSKCSMQLSHTSLILVSFQQNTAVNIFHLSIF